MELLPNQKELFDVVDKNDNILKSGLEESELHINDDITRVVTLYLFDKDRKLIISQRVKNKNVDPLKFEAPAHGRVRSGESYKNAVLRESKEELGIDLSKIFEVAYFYYNFESNVGIRHHFKKLYIGFTNQEIIFDKNEINDMKKFDSYEDFKDYYQKNKGKFTNALKFDMEKLAEFIKINKNVLS